MNKSVVTISREYGSGGYEIGKKLAETLNYKFYDKSLLTDLAEKLMVPAEFVEKADNTLPLRRNIFHEVFPMFVNDDGEQANYIFNEQGKFIAELASQGNCVFAGRRADYYLRNEPLALHIFFYADLDFRIERIARTENCSAAEAEEKIREMDRRRKTSYEYTTGRTWADRHNYDRMICTSTFGIDRCVEEIAALLR